MSTLQDIVRAVEASTDDGSAAVDFKKGAHSTGEGDRYEERVLALVFLRCVRQRLRFQLSANNSYGGKFDDIVLVWRARDHPEARILFVQLKHKTAPKHLTIHRDAWLSPAESDFALGKYSTSYRKISEPLGKVGATFVLMTNSGMHNTGLDIFERHVDSVPWLDLLEAGGELYKLKPNNQQVLGAVGGDTSFVEHFYVLCKQRNFDKIVDDVKEEVEELLGAGDLCGSICDSLFNSLRVWMNDQNMCLTSSWSIWQAAVDEYIRNEVTMQTEVTTRLKYCRVAVSDVRRHLESCNPAWVRPPEKGTAGLSATKVHQAIIHNKHIMVPISRFRVLQHKILRCWGQFCQWLVIVDDDGEDNSGILSEILPQINSERRLVIVSSRENNGFIDTCRSCDISDYSWQECLNIIVRLNGDHYECRLRDLVTRVDAIKSLLDGKPAILLALVQQSQPLRMGQDLETLPSYYIHRRLLTRQVVTEQVFWTLGNIREYARGKLEAFSTANKIAIVEGIPGVGKSKLLSHMAKHIKERDPSCWLLRVNLSEFYTDLDSSKCAKSALESILQRTVFNKGHLGSLEYTLIRHVLLQSPRVVCLVDSFDEVCPDFEDKCLEMLPLLAPCKGQLVVTTRTGSVRLLVDRLHVLTHTLEPFNKLELEKFFKHHPLSRDIAPISGLNKSMTHLLRIPLFAEMFAELSLQQADTYNIVTLYEAFFLNKFMRLHREKYGENFSIPGKKKEIEEAQKQHEEQLMNLAASVLLHNTDKLADMTFDRKYFVKAGIVYEFADGKPAFLHRTFAEHFLAKWCFIGAGQQCRGAVYRKAYTDGTLDFFVESFDRRAVKGRPLLEAIMGGDESKVEALLVEGANPKQADACRRNALHLVAAHSDLCPARLLRGLCNHMEAVEATLSAEDGLLGWTPMRYAAESGNFPAVEQLLDLGGDLSHLGDFTPVHHDPTQLQDIFKWRGYRALYKHVIEVKRLYGRESVVQMKFAVSLIAANLAEETLKLIAEKAVQEGHTIVHRLLLRGNISGVHEETECPIQSSRPSEKSS